MVVHGLQGEGEGCGIRVSLGLVRKLVFQGFKSAAWLAGL